MIREYQPADCQHLLKVWSRASALAHSFLSAAFMEQERHNIPNVYLPIAETWVFEADGLVAGFLSLLGNEVGALFVDPDMQRCGIGRALLEQARALKGELEVEVFVQNLQGRAFYAKAGFVLLQRKVHEPSGFEVLRLRLPKGNPTAADRRVERA